MKTPTVRGMTLGEVVSIYYHNLRGMDINLFAWKFHCFPNYLPNT